MDALSGVIFFCYLITIFRAVTASSTDHTWGNLLGLMFI